VTICPNCGAELRNAQARFCSNCGAQVSTETVHEAKSTSTTPQVPSSPSVVQTQAAKHSHPVLHEQIAQQPQRRGSVAHEQHTPVAGTDVRELRIKVWDVDEGNKLVETQEQANVDVSVDKEKENERKQAIEQLATTPLISYRQEEMPKSVGPARSPSMPVRSVPPVLAGEGWRSRKLVIMGVGLVAALIILGSIVWAIVLQPFSVSPVTAPLQHFQSTHFGISLLYPTGWKVQADTKASILRFTDSTDTDQVTITVSNAAGTNEIIYVQKLAAQLGMTNVKIAAPLTFAGAQWQQLQGSVLVRGASYTETLFVTVHGSHLYTLEQLAPQGTYAQEEHVVFAPMRSSLRFLS
jgi:hypothetical protein